MSDPIDELCALVKAAGGTMRLYGRPVTADELRGAMHSRVDAKLGNLAGLPTPSLSATIIPPHRRGDLGEVVVAVYAPPDNAYDPDDDGSRGNGDKPRKRPTCRLCGIVGHVSSNFKYHPRTL